MLAHIWQITHLRGMLKSLKLSAALTPDELAKALDISALTAKNAALRKVHAAAVKHIPPVSTISSAACAVYVYIHLIAGYTL